VVDVGTGQVVFERRGADMLSPASTMKVITSAAALKNLGPSYRFTTDVYYDGEIDPDGTLTGNLYVKGHGDPTFVVEKLWKMIAELELMGVERIDGNVVFDDSFHGGGTTIVGWDKADDVEKGTAYFATLSALSLDANAVVMMVRPGRGSSSRSRARSSPTRRSSSSPARRPRTISIARGSGARSPIPRRTSWLRSASRWTRRTST
jgi:D-alanyl-D-alanine carboxypeptidase/D-alanyl-D-alanine-endopeptidase (penicillin-binding protein 4)